MGKTTNTNSKKTQQTRRETNSNFMLVTIIIFMFLMLTGIIFIYKNNEYQLNQIRNTMDEGTRIEVEDSIPNIKKEEPIICEGHINSIYQGEFNGQIGNFTLIEKQILTLKEDGTYTREFENAGGSSGTYDIKNGELMLTYIPMGSPSSYKITETLQISSDCSTILINGEGYSYNLIKQ